MADFRINPQDDVYATNSIFFNGASTKDLSLESCPNDGVFEDNTEHPEDCSCGCCGENPGGSGDCNCPPGADGAPGIDGLPGLPGRVLRRLYADEEPGAYEFRTPTRHRLRRPHLSASR